MLATPPTSINCLTKQQIVNCSLDELRRQDEFKIIITKYIDRQQQQYTIMSDATSTTPSTAAAVVATTTNANTNEKTMKSPPSSYYAMVVDSGPIIKQDVRNLMGKATTYVTTPSVLREIRDS